MAIDRSKSGGLTANAFGRDDVGVAAAMMVGKLSLAKQNLAKPWLSASLSVGGPLGAGAEAVMVMVPACMCLSPVGSMAPAPFQDLAGCGA